MTKAERIKARRGEADTRRRRASAYVNEKATTAVANIALYSALVLDILFLAVAVAAGHDSSFIACLAIVLAVEIVSLIVLLPVPILQVGIVTRNIFQAVAFALMPILEFIFTIYISSYGSGAAVYAMFAVGRTLAWGTAFFLSRVGAAAGGGVLVAVVLVILSLALAAPKFEFPLFTRPLDFTYTEEYGGGYAVTRVGDGWRDNVVIPEYYRGERVVAVDTGDSNIEGAENIVLPESVKYVNLQSGSLRSLTVKAPDLRFGELGCSSLERLTFTDGSKLPSDIPETIGEAVIEFDRKILPDALSKFEHLRDNLVPITEEGEGYVIYYTDCNLYGGEEIEGFDYRVEFNREGENIVLEYPDLKEHGYDFIGWFTSRAYADKLAEVRGGEKSRLFAKYLKIYHADLYDESGTELEETIDYNVETPSFALPKRSKEGYEFCGWFPVGVRATKGNEVTGIYKGTDGNRSYYPEFKKLYKITYHLDGAENTQNLPSTYHEWSDNVTFASDGASRAGYVFMGWFTDPEYTSYISTIYPSNWANLGTMRDLDIYLKFNREYTVSLNTDGGTAEWYSRKYHRDTGFIQLPTPTRTGYIFDGWFASSDFSGGKVVGFTGEERQSNQSFYAKWTPVTYRIKYRNEENGYNYMVGPVFTYDGENNTLDDCTFFGNTGYTFTHWVINGKPYKPNEVIRENFASRQDAEVIATAQWEPISYTMRFLPDADDATGEMPDATHYYENSFTTPECKFEREGYRFKYWSIKGVVYYPGYWHMATLSTEQDDVIYAYAVWEKIEPEEDRG